MKTLQEQLTALDRSHAEKRQKLIAEYSILDALPEGLRERASVFMYSLYGSIGTITLKYNHFKLSTDKAEQPTLTTILELASLFPPIPLYDVRDGGCRSIQPVEYVEGLPADKRERIESETPIAPFTVKIWYVRGGDPTNACFEWYSKLPNGSIVECNVELPLYGVSKLGNLIVQHGKNGELQRVTKDEFTPNYNAIGVLKAEDGTQLCQINVITYTAGSTEQSRQRLITWNNYREGATATLADLVRHLS